MDIAGVNLAHQQQRKAELYLRSGKYEDALACHQKASDLLTEALNGTLSPKAKESLTFQRDFHIREQVVVRYKQRLQEMAKAAGPPAGARMPKLTATLHIPAPPAPKAEDLQLALYNTMAENDSLLQFLVRPASLNGTEEAESEGTAIIFSSCVKPKDDQTVIEELRTNNEELRRLVKQLLEELDKCCEEKAQLQQAVDDLQKRIQRPVSRPNMATDAHSPLVDFGNGLRELPVLAPLEMPHFDFNLLKSDHAKSA